MGAAAWSVLSDPERRLRYDSELDLEPGDGHTHGHSLTSDDEAFAMVLKAAVMAGVIWVSVLVFAICARRAMASFTILLCLIFCDAVVVFFFCSDLKHMLGKHEE